jgi:membrane fusion protein, multidrug efflux system
MIRRFGFGIILLALSMGLLSCPGKEEGKNRGEKIGGRPPVAVEVAKVEVVDHSEGIDVVGSLAPKFAADVRSEYAGIVTEVYVNEWVRVKKGTPLAKIDSREMEILLQKAGAAVEMAKATLLQAEVAGNRATREYGRLVKLKERGVVTQQALDDGLTEKEASAARIEAARAQLRAAEEDLRHTQTRLSKTTILSPMEGVVSSRVVNIGDLVGEAGSQKIMFRIIDTRILDLTVTVPSVEMGMVHVGLPLTFSTDAIPGETFTGKVMFINPVVNESDRSVKVTAEVKNVSEQLKGGLYVKGRIGTGKRTGILRVPRGALLSWDVAGKKGDLFVVKGEIANRRTVQTGAVMGDFVEIISGLVTDEQVVVRGGFNLKDGDRVNVTQVNRG